jgi:hypothetical protein
MEKKEIHSKEIGDIKRDIIELENTMIEIKKLTGSVQ